MFGSRLTSRTAAVAAAFGVGVAAASFGAIHGFASHPTTSSGSAVLDASTQGGAATALCNDFLGRFAGDLGKSQSDVESALLKAASQTIDDQVKAGHLSQKKADAIKAQLNKVHSCADLPSAMPKQGGRHGGPGMLGPSMMQTILGDAASALKLQPAQLQAQIAAGKTLHQIADAQNVTKAQFDAALTAALTNQLKQQVSNGTLNQTQEQHLLSMVPTLTSRLWDRSLNQGLGMGIGGGGFEMFGGRGMGHGMGQGMGAGMPGAGLLGMGA